MRTCLIAFTVLAFLAPLVSQGQEKIDNPYQTAKVGDYAAYKVTTSIGGMNLEMEMKQTLTAKDDKEATVKTTTKFMGNEIPPQTSKIDLTKPFDFTSAAMQAKGKGKFEKTGEGKEKIKIGDTTYDCTWFSGKVTGDAKGKKIESDVKVWMSKSVALSGMVKMELKSNIVNMQMELSGSGNEK